MNDLPRGAIIGAAEVTDVLMPDDESSRRIMTELDAWLTGTKDHINYCLWKLEQPRLFTHPVVCKGSLNLWQVSDAVMRKVLDKNDVD